MPSPPTAMTIKARDATIRETRQYLRDNIRNDWTFESTTLKSYPPPAVESTAVNKWRPWDYDSSESEMEELTRATAATSISVGGISVQNHGAEHASAVLDENKDMTPAERKMKRQRDMEEEMTWNEGLRVWQARREAWAGARKKRDVEMDKAVKVKEARERNDQHNQGDKEDRRDGTEQRDNGGTSQIRQQRQEDDEDRVSSASTSPSYKEPKQSTDTTVTEPEPTSPSSLSPTSVPQAEIQNGPSRSDDNYKTLLPVAPPLLPADHPIRASITPSLYPSIYSKVVIQGLNPTIPINLADMTRCLVQGWQADGQWPASPVPIYPGRGGNGPNNTTTANYGSAASQGARRGNRATATTTTATAGPRTTINTSSPPKNTSTTSPMSPVSPSTAGSGTPSSPESKRRSSLTNAVKKVFHFSGIHRRSASSQSGQVPADPFPHGG